MFRRRTEPTDRERAAFQPLDRLIPARYFPLALALIFVTSLYGLYLLLPVANEHDWIRTAQHLRYLARGQNAYDRALGFQDSDLYVRSLRPLLHPQGEAVAYSALPYSPWYVFYFGVIAYSSVRVVMALTFAAWLTLVIGTGHPVALLLALHPLMIFVWGAGTIDFLVNGVGLWLVLMGVTGMRRGVALMLIATRPHVLPLLLALEGVRVLRERDGAALLTMAALGGVAIVLFPGWIERFASTLVSVAPDADTLQQGRSSGFGRYSFSIFGAWGLFPALGVTLLVLLLMRRRLTEWRALAVLLSLVWTPYVNPYSYAVLLVLFLRVPPWRIVAFWGISLVTSPLFFTQFHRYERYGLLMFLLLTPLLTVPDPAQTEEAIAARHNAPVLPLVPWLARWRDGFRRVPADRAAA